MMPEILSGFNKHSKHFVTYMHDAGKALHPVIPSDVKITSVKVLCKIKQSQVRWLGPYREIVK